MHYEINVSKKTKTGIGGGTPYSHYFATHARSITNKPKLREVLKDFERAFPEPEFNITAIKVQTIGETVNVVETMGKDKPTINKSELGINYYMYGNKGDVEEDRVHIFYLKSTRTLCGTPMLAANAAHYPNYSKHAKCPECVNNFKALKEKVK